MKVIVIVVSIINFTILVTLKLIAHVLLPPIWTPWWVHVPDSEDFLRLCILPTLSFSQPGQVGNQTPESDHVGILASMAPGLVGPDQA